MSDRELLALAAKACGAKFSDYSDRTPDHWQSQHSDGVWKRWDPLNDDGDAFRLMLKLQIKIEYWPENDSVLCSLPGSMGATSVGALGDVELRYAIVQAAAQLGATL